MNRDSSTHILLVADHADCLGSTVESAQLPAGQSDSGSRPQQGEIQASQASQVSFHVGMTLEEVERQMLFKTMAHFNNHKPKAAQALGISLKTVYNRLARFGYAGSNTAAGARELESSAIAG